MERIIWGGKDKNKRVERFYYITIDKEIELYFINVDNGVEIRFINPTTNKENICLTEGIEWELDKEGTPLCLDEIAEKLNSREILKCIKDLL